MKLKAILLLLTIGSYAIEAVGAWGSDDHYGQGGNLMGTQEQKVKDKVIRGPYYSIGNLGAVGDGLMSDFFYKQQQMAMVQSLKQQSLLIISTNFPTKAVNQFAYDMRENQNPSLSDGKYKINGQSLLHFLISRSLYHEQAQRLITIAAAAGLSFEDVDENGETVLHLAARAKNSILIKQLVQAGACVGAKNIHFQTPLEIYKGVVSTTDTDKKIILKLLRQQQTSYKSPDNAEKVIGNKFD